ncbi:type II toxin-antitoxin system RelB/DinJ family antitoxin [uncultured Adlercreutzia sp.]|uniref:type II toxin-antitoxin system RelB/DinJ family antitoxin n=1 Tax=uncultured Adlercreutzia sp. TaxID=875803 RepID=UPI0026F39726|nr:type II toxin-antitoxin system RelB/DinJ family antitoxin [uncultured Adlercreutzia sp.]
MTASTVTIRIDSNDKKEASAIAEFFGFDLSSVTRAFYKQMIRERRIPLDLSMPEPNESSLKAIEEAEEFFALGKPARFKTADAMIASLED